MRLFYIQWQILHTNMQTPLKFVRNMVYRKNSRSILTATCTPSTWGFDLNFTQMYIDKHRHRGSNLLPLVLEFDKTVFVQWQILQEKKSICQQPWKFVWNMVYSKNCRRILTAYCTIHTMLFNMFNDTSYAKWHLKKKNICIIHKVLHMM